MRNLALIAILAIALTSCQWKNHPLNAKEKMVCGQWMGNERGNNREKFVFSSDHWFQDLRSSNDSASNPRGTEVWQITGDQLDLKYRTKAFIIPIHYTTQYHIITLNDSAMVIASKGTRKLVSRIITLKKMKLSGKFIQG